METQKVEIIEKDALALPEQVKSLGERIEDEATLKRVNDAKLYVRKIRGRIKDVFEPMKKKSYAAYKEILNKWKEVEAPAIRAERYCDRLLSDYFAEQRRKREEAERKRLEEERKRREEEERRLQEAMEAEEKGDKEKAEQIINETAEEEKNTKPEITVPEKPKLDNIHSRLDFEFQIIDKDAIPRQYMVPDEKLIRRVVKASKGKVNIPGIKIITKDRIVARR
ncbi:MAG: hypothetical protein ACOC5F_06260 [Candidatus Aminicenantaceae bacterium]